MKRVLIVTQYFWPEYFRVNDLAIGLSENNIEVDVLTGYPNYPQGFIYPEFLKNRRAYKKLKNINIYRVPIYPRKSGDKISLTLNYLSFVFSGIFIGFVKLRKKNYDYVITFATSPILSALVAIFFSKLKRSKHFLWVLDLWPQVLIDLNIIKNNSLIHKLFKIIVKFIYTNSDLILCQSLSFKKEIFLIDNKFKKKLIYFPSWPEELPQTNNGFSEYKFDKNYLNILFAGNIGESQNFEYVIKLFNNLKNDKIRLYVIGEGRNFNWLKNKKEINKLDNIILLGQKKFNDIQYYFINCAVLLISLVYKQTFNSTIPGKFQTYLQYNKPILGLLGGETSQIINKYNIGLSFDDNDINSLVAKLRNFSNLKFNNKNCEILLKIFSKKRSLKKLIILFNNFSYKDKVTFKVISDPLFINYNKNFIIVGLNLAFLGYYSAKLLPINKINYLWPDGFFKNKLLSTHIKKVPGRDFLNSLNVDVNIIKKIFILGNATKLSLNYLKNLKGINKLEVCHIPLPMGELEDFVKHIPKLTYKDLCIVTIPTPKQEKLANYIYENQINCKVICLGGALNMASGLEKILPERFSHIFFAEALWRLKFDTFRRLARLIYTFYYYLLGEIFHKYKKMNFVITNEKF
jgi:glycosyltransferase involved in cell wall biosynthesis/UDP-N-acetyl-D-mannosaminuronic acid transferase (WecB/TagA/CpsF family)